jgi:hypothetical protein
VASTSTVVLDRPGAIVIRIDHGVADSFSRSVIPTSTRAWKRLASRGTAHCRTLEFAPDWTVSEDRKRCASFAAFGPTHVAAESVLKAYLDTVQPHVPTACPH